MTLTDRLPESADPDALYAAFAVMGAAPGPHPVPAPGRGADRDRLRRQRDPVHADRLGQEPRRGRRALRRAGERRSAASTPRRSRRWSRRSSSRSATIFGAGRGRHDDGRRQRQRATRRSSAAPPRSSPTIALRDGASGRRRPGGHGRVPLLRRPGPRLGLAGTAARAAAGAVPADVGDARRRHQVRGRPDPAHRPADRRGHAPPSVRSRCASATRSTPLHETIEELLAHQAGARSTSCTSRRPRRIERAQALMSVNVCSRSEKDAIAELIGGFRFDRRVRQDAVAAASGTASACTTRACCRSTAGSSRRSPRPACSR